MRIADRSEHTAHVRADRHQRADQHRMLLHVSHGEHRDREWNERDQRHIIGNQHAGKIGERNQRDHQSALETAHHQHQADQLRNGARMNISAVLLVGRHDKA